MKSNKATFTNLPKSVGIIMDGNGRWAKKRLLARSFGHKEGVKTLEKTLSNVFELGIEYVTVYAFSTENQNRPKDEVDSLFNLIKEYFQKKLSRLIKDEIRVRVIGDRSYFNDEITKIISNAEEKTASFKGRNFVIALNYGSRNEIVNACNMAVERGEKVTEESFSQLLYTKDIPDPDVLIRTGGEKRISNFLLYQLAYTEFFFLDTLWPDFDGKKLLQVLDEFQNRSRRFGKV